MKPKVVYLLLDFDGVMALYLSQLNPESEVYKKKYSSIKDINKPKFELFAKIMLNVIENRLKSSINGANLVILAVGSGRQTRQHDSYASECNDHNGLCFPLFADLAERNGWQFNCLLMPDCPNPPYTFENLGKTMGPFEKDTLDRHVLKADTYSDNLFWPENKQLLTQGKKDLLALHLAYIERYYPASQYDVTLEFWDDDPLHIKTFRAYAERYRSTLSVSLLTRHFNWTETANKFDGNEESFTLALEQHIDTQIHHPLKNPPRLGSFSFWETGAIKTFAEINTPYSWLAIGFSAFFLAYALMNQQEPQLNDLKPKSMY